MLISRDFKLFSRSSGNSCSMAKIIVVQSKSHLHKFSSIINMQASASYQFVYFVPFFLYKSCNPNRPEFLSQCYLNRQRKRCHGRILWMKIKSKQKKVKSRLRTSYSEETSFDIFHHQMRIDFAFTASVEKWSLIWTHRISCSIRLIYQCKRIQTKKPNSSIHFECIFSVVSKCHSFNCVDPDAKCDILLLKKVSTAFSMMILPIWIESGLWLHSKNEPMRMRRICSINCHDAEKRWKENLLFRLAFKSATIWMSGFNREKIYGNFMCESHAKSVRNDVIRCPFICD